MKVVLLIGNQQRHLFLARKVIEMFPSADVIVMSREDMVPEPPAGTTDSDAKLFRHHFALRKAVEENSFGRPTITQILKRTSVHLISADQLNSTRVAELFVKMEPDVCIVFGTDLIKAPVFDLLPPRTFNVHLGLSPWYRGSATLFWPFYFMEPQWAGVTVHQLIKNVDAGGIAFQSVPSLSRGMGIHDVACSAVIQATDELLRMLEAMTIGQNLKLVPQVSTGRIFRIRDFRPTHLKVNYEIFGDRMVDSWLDGDLLGTSPSIIQLTHD